MTTHDEQVDRVAKAMWQASELNDKPDWDGEDEVYYMHLARSAIAALRDEPSLVQIEIAREAIDEAHDFTHDEDWIGVRRSLSHARHALSELPPMQRDEPSLEDVLGGRFTIGDVTPTGDDQWIAIVEEWDEDGNHVRSLDAWEPSIDAAIRQAVANAKGGQA